MDQEIRNKLRSVVTQCRKLLEDSISQELEGKYGIFAKKDKVTADPDAPVSHLTGEEREARKDILDHYAHIQARGFKPKESLDQLVREIAFTHLNRLCAYKMMEAREVFVGGQKFREAVSRGVNSNGVKFYLAEHEEDERLFNTGHQDVAYRHFLDWLGGALSDEIGVLFNPNDPANRLYPRQKTLDEVLDLLNSGGIKSEETELRSAWPSIWSQDETIGWVYQYFTPRELRDEARKESRTPRNSYELAFRNQFFTPRYVVEFLTDNTLGRIWYEMRQGRTRLADHCRYLVRRCTEIFLEEGEQPGKNEAEVSIELSKEQVLKLPVYIPHRPKKDPRELKILDPACGSGHFLLYCFDLLLVIYEEAYEDPDLGPTLQQDYPTLEDLRRAVPGLILAHNLHGVDIDLRASQIAALALWLRCQRAYQELGVTKTRPKITRSNFVCAEPMPGEQSMLREFVDQIEPALLGQLVEIVFDKMKLAGEAGSLLKIEEEIRDAVARARGQWLSGSVSTQQLLFDDNQPVVQQQRFDFTGITDAQFFEQAEAKVTDALRQYAERENTGHRLQRRLFAEDAVRGFAFVDLCHRRYDVVLMNPPFGENSSRPKEYVDSTYTLGKHDLCTAFVERADSLLSTGGCIGAISTRTGFFRKHLEGWRKAVALQKLQPFAFADLGYGVLDTAKVETAAYCLSRCTGDIVAAYIRVSTAAEKDHALAKVIAELGHGQQEPNLYLVSASVIKQIPGYPFAYWATDRIRRIYSEFPHFETGNRIVRVGVQTSDDFRFLRCWWEVPPSALLDSHNGPDWRHDLDGFQSWCRQRTHQGKRWVPFSKGGEYTPYFSSLKLVINWEHDGLELKAWAAPLYGNSGWSRIIKSVEHYFKPGLTFLTRTSIRLCSVPLPAGSIFSNVSPCAFLPLQELYPGLARLNSLTGESLLSLYHARGADGDDQTKKYEAGQIQQLPWPKENSESVARLCGEVSEAIANYLGGDETCHAFVSPNRKPIASDHELVRLIIELEQIVAKEYRITVEEARSVIQPDVESLRNIEEDIRAGLNVTILSTAAETARPAAIISYCLGCVMGRWDVRIAHSADEASANTDPFASVPVCSPGMLHDSEGLPLTHTPDNYPIAIDSDGILVDDIDHSDDIVRRVREVLDVAWIGEADAIEIEGFSSAGTKSLRDYFRKSGTGGFWDSHVSRYSKSRRKAPIFWLLQSSKKNYALWFYYHRLDKDLLFKALVNYVEPKIRLETSRLETLHAQKSEAGESGKEAKRLAKEVERQEDFLSELRDFEDKLRRAANLHLEPDLNDGVVLNIAPLHELVPWKEAKKYWEELLAGKYEWSSIGKQFREKGIVK